MHYHLTGTVMGAGMCEEQLTAVKAYLYRRRNAGAFRLFHIVQVCAGKFAGLIAALHKSW